jgi:hypothetical protein
LRGIIPITLVVQVAISILAIASARSDHHVATDGADTFRISPSAAWFITIGAFGFATFLAVVILAAKPTPMNAPIGLMLGEMATFVVGLYGIYCITMRIVVDSQSMCVKSLFRKRIAQFSEIRSVTDNVTGNYRTLEVLNVRGKRLLKVTSSFLPDYDDLVGLLQNGIGNRQNSSRLAP